MLDAGNPYVLPSVVVGAATYLGVTVLTDASLLVRVGVLVGIVGVVPVVLNRLLGGGTEASASDEPATEGIEAGAEDPDERVGDDGEMTTDDDAEPAANR